MKYWRRFQRLQAADFDPVKLQRIRLMSISEYTLEETLKAAGSAAECDPIYLKDRKEWVDKINKSSRSR